MPVEEPPLTARDLGFGVEESGDGEVWRKAIAGEPVAFRLLRKVPDLLSVEALQRAVFGVDERDLAAASQLVVAQETGGLVIGAFANASEREPATEELVGFLIAWGGYVEGRPRLVSDMLGVRGDRRGGGLGAELKKLQAVLALARGFPEVVWTVDPLRAANARLNFEKLGAYADRYEEDRYGAGYGAGLYGGLPTDRLHVTWPLLSANVRDRLLGRVRPLTSADIRDLLPLADACDADRALVTLPADIDGLVATDPSVARQWRFALRKTLQTAFAAGYAVTGFVPSAEPTSGNAAYVVERRQSVGGRR
jgi:predicted GNAT superfamily acetyltransferase